MPRNYRWLALPISLVLALGLTGCSKTQTDTPAPAASAEDDTTAPAASAEDDPSCFLPVTPQQMATQPVNKSYNVEGSLCVLDIESGTARYYNEADGFADYGFYAMLMRRFLPLENVPSLQLADLDATELMAIEHIIGFDDDDGLPYRLYAQSTGGDYVRAANDTELLPGVTVQSIQYGAAQPRPFADALATPAPGYDNIYYVTADPGSESLGGNHDKKTTPRATRSSAVPQPKKSTGSSSTSSPKTGSSPKAGSNKKTTSPRPTK